VPWKFVEKLFFNKGLLSGLILLGQGEKQDFSRKKIFLFYTNIFLDKKTASPRFFATIANLPNNAWVQNNLENVWHNSEPSY